jgi:hypothetical protein
MKNPTCLPPTSQSFTDFDLLAVLNSGILPRCPAAALRRIGWQLLGGKVIM